MAARGLLMLGLLLAGSGSRAEDPREKWLDPGKALTQVQKEAFLRRVFIDKEAFLGSAEYKAAPATLYLYFKDPEYQKLRGNPIIGYLAPDEGFQWSGREVTLGPVLPLGKGTRVATEKAWEAAMNQIAHAMDLEVKPLAPVKITGATVFVRTKPTAEYPACQVGVEWKVTSPTGVILFRRVASARTVGDAMGSCLEFVLRFARNYGSRKPEGAEGASSGTR